MYICIRACRRCQLVYICVWACALNSQYLINFSHHRASLSNQNKQTHFTRKPPMPKVAIPAHRLILHHHYLDQPYERLISFPTLTTQGDRTNIDAASRLGAMETVKNILVAYMHMPDIQEHALLVYRSLTFNRGDNQVRILHLNRYSNTLHIQPLLYYIINRYYTTCVRRPSPRSLALPLRYCFSHPLRFLTSFPPIFLTCLLPHLLVPHPSAMANLRT